MVRGSKLAFIGAGKMVSAMVSPHGNPNLIQFLHSSPNAIHAADPVPSSSTQIG